MLRCRHDREVLAPQQRDSACAVLDILKTEQLSDAPPKPSANATKRLTEVTEPDQITATGGLGSTVVHDQPSFRACDELDPEYVCCTSHIQCRSPWLAGAAIVRHQRSSKAHLSCGQI